MIERLFGKCDTFCQVKGGDMTKKGVFVTFDDENGRYYCGLGNTNCINVKSASKSASYEQKKKELEEQG